MPCPFGPSGPFAHIGTTVVTATSVFLISRVIDNPCARVVGMVALPVTAIYAGYTIYNSIHHETSEPLPDPVLVGNTAEETKE